MVENRGKKFEEVIRKSFLSVPDTSVTRLHDQMSGFSGSKNICDFIVYHYPYQYFIECKSVHGNTLPFSNITDNQWQGLLEVSKVKGVIAGVICWWVDLDKTYFIPIQKLEVYKNGWGAKSINLTKQLAWDMIEINGKKKRVFLDYDMQNFFNKIV